MQTLRFSYPLRRYIHERLGQCPEQERLEARARQLASDAGRSWPLVGPLEARLYCVVALPYRRLSKRCLPLRQQSERLAARCCMPLHLQLHPLPTA